MAIRRPLAATIVTSVLIVTSGAAGASLESRLPLESSRPVADVPAPFFWDGQAHQRVGADADRFELDDPVLTADMSAWYHLSFIAGGDHLQVHDDNPPTTTGSDSDLARTENVAWHVATVLLGRAAGVARAGEIPEWARPRTGNADGRSAGLLFALADLDLRTPGWLAGSLRVAATGAIGSDGAVTAVRMVDAKVAAARLAHADVVFAPDFPADASPVTEVRSHVGLPTATRTIGDWLNVTSYEAAGRHAERHRAPAFLVAVDDIRQALAWLCGYTQMETTCAFVHRAAAVPLPTARPYIRFDPTADLGRPRRTKQAEP